MKLTPRQRNIWFLIAAIAVGAALLFMLVPQAHHANSSAWLAILPALFLGIISPLTLFPPIEDAYAGRAPDAPSLPAAFQRPPPFPFA